MPTLIDAYVLYAPEYLYSCHPSADVSEILEGGATLSKLQFVEVVLVVCALSRVQVRRWPLIPHYR